MGRSLQTAHSLEDVLSAHCAPKTWRLANGYPPADNTANALIVRSGCAGTTALHSRGSHNRLCIIAMNDWGVTRIDGAKENSEVPNAASCNA